MPTFVGLAGGSVLLGVGYTFISGAHQAWLADEIGELPAAPAYVRATQVSQLAHVAGVLVGVALASIDLRLPMLAGGAGYWVLAALLIAIMPERAYKPVDEPRRSAWQAMRATLRDSVATVRARPELASILGIVLLYGMSSEGAGRLAPLHFVHGVGLPDRFSEATWFGVLNGGSFLGGAMVTTLVGRAAESDNPRRLMQALLGLTILMIVATFVFAVAPAFWAALLSFWIARWVRIAVGPLLTARVALVASAGVLLPAVGLYAHALSRLSPAPPTCARPPRST